MPQLLRYAVVAVVLVDVAAVGGALLLTRSGKLGPASVARVEPRPDAHPNSDPDHLPHPVQVAPGIAGWTTFTSAVYGGHKQLPLDGWTSWRPRPRLGTRRATSPTASKRTVPESSNRDGEDIALLVYQRPAGSGADITSREGLAAWFQANLCDDQAEACETVPEVAEPMCVGKSACLPAILVFRTRRVVQAVFANSQNGLVTVVSLGRL